VEVAVALALRNELFPDREAIDEATFWTHPESPIERHRPFAVTGSRKSRLRLPPTSTKCLQLWPLAKLGADLGPCAEVPAGPGSWAPPAIFILPETVRVADSPTSRQSFDHDEVFYVQFDLAGTLGGTRQARLDELLAALDGSMRERIVRTGARRARDPVRALARRFRAGERGRPGLGRSRQRLAVMSALIMQVLRQWRALTQRSP
jgi:hypothetical protein